MFLEIWVHQCCANTFARDCTGVRRLNDVIITCITCTSPPSRQQTQHACPTTTTVLSGCMHRPTYVFPDLPMPQADRLFLRHSFWRVSVQHAKHNTNANSSSGTTIYTSLTAIIMSTLAGDVLSVFYSHLASHIATSFETRHYYLTPFDHLLPPPCYGDHSSSF